MKQTKTEEETQKEELDKEEHLASLTGISLTIVATELYFSESRVMRHDDDDDTSSLISCFLRKAFLSLHFIIVKHILSFLESSLGKGDEEMG